MSFVAAAIAYTMDQPRRAVKKQSAALEAQIDADAAATAKAETDAATSANALRVQQKRAMRANALGLGGTRDDNAQRSVLSAGAPASQRSASATVLGGGKPMSWS